MRDAVGGAPRRTAGERAHARLELLQRKGLHEVVVGPGIEPLHAVVDRVAGGQDQHRRRVAPATQLLQDREAIEARQAQVEDDRGERGNAAAEECASEALDSEHGCDEGGNRPDSGPDDRIDGELHPEAHLHAQFYPPYRTRDRLKYLAGTELAAGFFAMDALPEEKARELQQVEVAIG